MTRLLLGLLGALLAALPDRTLTVYESVAFESAGEATPKPWLESAIRTEGIAYVAIALIGGRPYRWLATLVGVIGTVVLAAPHRYLDAGASVAYDRSGDLEWSDRFVSVVRAIGAGCVLFAIGVRRRRDGNT
ncbi:hypothetical protein [Halopenitus persicus]|uniref:DoxX-like family protein n=1 Tax=Halopenitus persicus TaxID=1048396 RepID=A0A1H3J113_9EURY|nr:hypothetical protein [Halopenitus persicus]QHS17339.1 hypothetical protein GWK26_09385 [haloarchaeon 3A1-DGR]SDY33656.1 hypothetical protein SAMN05216564_104346 [Halopenitus persicus]